MTALATARCESGRHLSPPTRFSTYHDTMLETLRCRLLGHAERERTITTERITGPSTTSSSESYRIVERCPRCGHDLPAMLNTQPPLTINSTTN